MASLVLLLLEFLRIRDYEARGGDYDFLLQRSNDTNITLKNEYPVLAVGGNEKIHGNNIIMAVTRNEEPVESEDMVSPLQLSVTELWP